MQHKDGEIYILLKNGKDIAIGVQVLRCSRNVQVRDVNSWFAGTLWRSIGKMVISLDINVVTKDKGVFLEVRSPYIKHAMQT